jgi:hypothetical protein
VKAARERLCQLVESGGHIERVGPPQPNNVGVDRATLQDILNLMKEAPTRFLQFHVFTAKFSWSQVEGLVTILLNRREPQHEFIHIDLEHLRDSFIKRAAYLLSMLQISMFPIPETPDFCSVMPYEREQYPHVYLDTVKNLDKLRVET